MRGLLALAAFVALTSGAEAALWTAACNDEKQLQYQQIIGQEGYLHQGSNGSYETIKLKQSYFDGKIVCGSVAAKAGPNEVAAICADNAGQLIRVLTGAQLAKGMRPEKAPVYCRATVSAN